VLSLLVVIYRLAAGKYPREKHEDLTDAAASVFVSVSFGTWAFYLLVAN
jgi:uncharacterized membrane protein YozB (DUF420 family)